MKYEMTYDMTNDIDLLWYLFLFILIGGGTCEEHDGTFTCYCPPGLAGAYCEHDVSKTSMDIASFTGNSQFFKTSSNGNSIEKNYFFMEFQWHDGQ